MNGAVRTARLLALCGLCLGFGLAARFGAPIREGLSAMAWFALFAKPWEVAFLALTASAAGLGGVAGALVGASVGALPATGEAALVAALGAAGIGDVALTAGEAGGTPAAVLFGMSLLVVAVVLGRRIMERRPRVAAPQAADLPDDRRPRTGRAAWLAVVAGLVWLHHDPQLRYRMLDQLHEGAHLAWASQMAGGLLPGDRLTLMYGPLYTVSLVGWMRVIGWTVVAERLYFSAAQVLGGVCLWFVLTRACRSVAGAVAGLVMVHLFTVSALVAYGWANGLRAGLGLASLVVAIDFLVRDGRPVRTGGLAIGVAAGVGLAASLAYSPEAGGAAVLAFGAIAAAVLAGGAARREVAANVAAVAAGCAGSAVAVVAWCCSGPWTDRIHALLGYSAAHLRGFMAVRFPVPVVPSMLTVHTVTEYVTGAAWIAWLSPVACAAVLTAVLAKHAAGQPLGTRDWRLAAIGVYGLLALSTVLNRSDQWHTLAASPAAVVLGAALLEQAAVFSRDLIRDRPARPVVLRWAYLAVMAPVLLAAAVDFLVTGSAARGFTGNVWGSKMSIARIERDADLTGGWRRPFDHPRSGGLVLARTQSLDLDGALAVLARRTKPGEPLFAGIGAEAMYFLADRPCASPFPVSVQAVTPSDLKELVASLDRCRLVVVNNAFQMDGKGWAVWEPAVAGVLRRDFVPAWAGSELAVWRRK